MNWDHLNIAIGRPSPCRIDTDSPLRSLSNERILITGAAGFIGTELTGVLRSAGVHVKPTDIDTTHCPWGTEYLDVNDFTNALEVVGMWEPTIIIHLAASKDAPVGEQNPWDVATTNVSGTKNVVNLGRKVVLASTCKAIQPETVYGASKLIGERMVLNAGGSVARFVNVPQCGPNVIDIWKAIPADEPLPVTPCTRYWMTLQEAVALLLWTCMLPQGRYKVDVGDPMKVTTFASRLFPDRAQVHLSPRRGDRLEEPLKGEHEWVAATAVQYIDRVESWHD